MAKWRKNGFYVRRVREYFEEHDSGSIREIRNWMLNRKENERRGRFANQIPEVGALRNMLLKMGCETKREKRWVKTGYNERFVPVDVYYKPEEGKDAC